ncbi:Trp biosynthesis-associated membrane protein [Microbacterium sp. A588]
MNAVKRGRSTAAIGFLLAGGIGIISSTQTWLTLQRSDGGEPILIPGADALALLAPLSLAVLALGAALAIAGVVLRYVFAVIALLAGGFLTWWTAEILIEAPEAAYAPTVTETTGLAGGTAVADVIQTLSPSLWPWAALIGWVLLIATALFVLSTARRWKSGGKRYRTDTVHDAEGTVDAIDSWDDLSRGTDPTQ